MNDQDNLDADLDAMFAHRSSAAPTTQPDFASVLAARQSRTRRRTAVATAGLVAVGITGIATFASTADDDRRSPVADGPADSGSPAVAGEGGFDALWYCEGAVDPRAAVPTTTLFPATTIGPTGTDIVDDVPANVPPIEDSGYFRHCELITTVPDAEFDNRFPTTTLLLDPLPATIPTTTIDLTVAPPDPAAAFEPVVTNEAGQVVERREYVVQEGDFPVKVADMFGIPLDDLLSFNGWRSFTEFPFPGGVVLIPPAEETAVHTTTTSLLLPGTTAP